MAMDRMVLKGPAYYLIELKPVAYPPENTLFRVLWALLHPGTFGP